YSRVESGKGELGIYLVGDNNVFPWRWKIRAADFNNLQILPHLLRGMKVADIVVILGSIDVIMGSVDR
ncbi:MAG: NADPH-quinone oxidoreductase, partial [Aphanizomenon sp.]